MLNYDQIEASEATIRDMAATVRSAVQNRIDHPSFGYSKTNIRQKAMAMEGAIGLYMVLTHQSSHASVPGLAEFRHIDTMTAVTRARQSVREM